MTQSLTLCMTFSLCPEADQKIGNSLRHDTGNFLKNCVLPFQLSIGLLQNGFTTLLVLDKTRKPKTKCLVCYGHFLGVIGWFMHTCTHLGLLGRPL